MSKSETILAQLRTACAVQQEQLLSAICDICVHTYRDTQEELDDRCETCPQVALAKQAIKDNYALGYSQGIYDGVSSVRAAYDTVTQEINERYRRKSPC